MLNVYGETKQVETDHPHTTMLTGYTDILNSCVNCAWHSRHISIMIFLGNHSILCVLSAVKLLNITDSHEVWYKVYAF